MSGGCEDGSEVAVTSSVIVLIVVVLSFERCFPILLTSEVSQIPFDRSHGKSRCDVQAPV